MKLKISYKKKLKNNYKEKLKNSYKNKHEARIKSNLNCARRKREDGIFEEATIEDNKMSKR